jgi:hypothetical protein
MSVARRAVHHSTVNDRGEAAYFHAKKGWSKCATRVCRSSRHTSRNWYRKAAVGAAIQVPPTGIRSTGCSAPRTWFRSGASGRRNSVSGMRWSLATSDLQCAREHVHRRGRRCDHGLQADSWDYSFPFDPRFGVSGRSVPRQAATRKKPSRCRWLHWICVTTLLLHVVACVVFGQGFSRRAGCQLQRRYEVRRCRRALGAIDDARRDGRNSRGIEIRVGAVWICRHSPWRPFEPRDRA